LRDLAAEGTLQRQQCAQVTGTRAVQQRKQVSVIIDGPMPVDRRWLSAPLLQTGSHRGCISLI
jgi:hypothetical protein